MSPNKYGVLPTSFKISKIAQRNLTLLTKVVQAIANNKTLQSYMRSMNKFVSKMQPKVDKFVKNLIKDPNAKNEGESWKHLFVVPETLKFDGMNDNVYWTFFKYYSRFQNDIISLLEKGIF